MEHNTNNPSNRSRKTLFVGIAAVAIVAVVYFSFFYPPAGKDDTSGTIGAAKKYRSEQITDKDVKLEGMQSTSSADQTISANVAGDLRNAAESLEKSVVSLQKTEGVKLDAAIKNNLERAAAAAINAARTYEQRPPGNPRAHFDATAAASLQKEIAGLEKSIQYVMERTVAVAAYQKTAPQASFDKTAPQASFDKTAPQASFDKTAPQASLDKTAPQASLDKTAPQASLDKTAPQASFDKTAPHANFDRTAAYKEIANRAKDLEKNAVKFEKSFVQLEQRTSEKE